jgi:beta-N-acetylhexosaminidase
MDHDTPHPKSQSGAPRDDTSRGTRLTRRSVLAASLGLMVAMPDAQAAPDKREQLVSDLLGDMGLVERIAQLFVFQAQGKAMTSAFQRQLESVKPGGIVFVLPNLGTADQVRQFVRAIHRSNPSIPPLIAIDQEGGNVVRLGGDPAPGAIELGRLSGDEARAKARDRARFLAGFGFDVNFAPVADVAYKSTSTMFHRSFGGDPKSVAETVSQVVHGSRQLDIMGAVKHFPGHGRTTIDSHVSVPEVKLTWNQWKKSDGLPFRAAIDAGVEMVMVGHLRYSKWDEHPTSLSRVAVSKLRRNLEFDRVILTDDLGMGALAGIDQFQVLDRAIDAGMDMLLCTRTPGTWEQMVDHVEKRVRRGEVDRKRIDASVRRILRLKVQHFHIHSKDSD